jgi:hypothetical protein
MRAGSGITDYTGRKTGPFIPVGERISVFIAWSMGKVKKGFLDRISKKISIETGQIILSNRVAF